MLQKITCKRCNVEYLHITAGLDSNTFMWLMNGNDWWKCGKDKLDWACPKCRRKGRFAYGEPKKEPKINFGVGTSQNVRRGSVPVPGDGVKLPEGSERDNRDDETVS